MPEVLHPGVFVEETGAGPRPIEGVPTSTAAFLGETERGGIRPRLITGYSEYLRWFGDVFDPDKFVPHAVRGFFENGGQRLYICRVVGREAKPAQAFFGDFTLQAAGPGSAGNRVWVRIEDGTAKKPDGTSVGFRLRLACWNGPMPGKNGKHSQITRYTMKTTPPFDVDVKSEKLIIAWESDGHNGAALCFGNDGTMYVTSGDVDGDSWADLITAAGAGGGPHIKVFSGQTGLLLDSFYAYAPDFSGGATVASADFNGDGRAEIAVGAGAGAAPHVKIFDLQIHDVLAGQLGSFMAFDMGVTGGVDVGTDFLAGDVNGDGKPDLVLGAGPGTGSRVQV